MFRTSKTRLHCNANNTLRVAPIILRSTRPWKLLLLTKVHARSVNGWVKKKSVKIPVFCFRTNDIDWVLALSWARSEIYFGGYYVRARMFYFNNGNTNFYTCVCLLALKGHALDAIS